MHYRLSLLPLTLGLLLLGCSEDSGADNNASSTTAQGDCDAGAMAAAVQAASWGANVTITTSDSEVRFVSDGLPTHATLDAYGLMDNTTTGVVATSHDISVPLCPKVASQKTDTNLGTIGVAISGAVFFDPYEGDGSTVALESNFDVNGAPFIDTCSGHPLPSGSDYHYHGIPYCITDTLDAAGQHSKMLGLLLDGFPLYGPKGEGGAAPTDLDECNAHFGPTPEHPAGITHYHLTETAPYSVQCYVGEVTVPAGGGMGPPPNAGMGPPNGGM